MFFTRFCIFTTVFCALTAVGQVILTFQPQAMPYYVSIVFASGVSYLMHIYESK